MLVHAVVWHEFRRVWLTVVVTVIVDDDRGAVVADDAPAERLGQQARHEHLVGRAVGEHTAGHQQHAIGPTGFGQVMGGEDHHTTIVSELFDHVEDAQLARQIEPGDRFVEEEELRFGNDGLGDEDALLLPARQVAERSTAEMPDLEQVGSVVDDLPVGRSEPTQQPEVGVSTHPQDLIDRQRHPSVVVAMLGDHRDAAGDHRVTVVVVDEVGEHGEQCRLATPVRADERDRCAGGDLERRRRERHGRAVVHAHVGHPDERIGGWSGCHENDSHSSMPRMVLNRRSVALVCMVTATLGACGGEPADSDDVTDESAPDVIATTSIWADIASQVLCRDVPALIPAGADPHTFEPSLRDREMLDGAGVVFANGGDLEGSLIDLLETADQVTYMTSRVDLIDGDPHIWQDPRRVAQAAGLMVDVAGDPDDPGCAEAFTEQLDRLDLDLLQLFQPIPENARVMVTSHDSLGYFAERYGLEVVGTVIPSTNTLAETNAADLGRLADLIEQRNVPAIFTEQLESSSDADALAERLGVRVVPLVTDALTDGGDGDHYLDMMRSNGEKIAEALAP